MSLDLVLFHSIETKIFKLDIATNFQSINAKCREVSCQLWHRNHHADQCISLYLRLSMQANWQLCQGDTAHSGGWLIRGLSKVIPSS